MDDSLTSTYSTDRSHLNLNAPNSGTLSYPSTDVFDQMQTSYQAQVAMHDPSSFGISYDVQSRPSMFDQRCDQVPRQMYDALSDDIQSQPSTSDQTFEQVLRKVYDAPSDCLPKDLLTDLDFVHGRSTFLHDLASKGRLGHVMRDVIAFCKSHCHDVDHQSDNHSTALHIAVCHDRLENVKILKDAGARTDVANKSCGELPLHVAIRTSKDPELVAYLLQNTERATSRQVLKPSTRRGESAVDLAVGRLLNALANPNKQDHVKTSVIILRQVLRCTKSTEDPRYLLAHVRQNKWLFKQAVLKVANIPTGRTLAQAMLEALLQIEREDPFHSQDVELMSFVQEVRKTMGLAHSM